MDPMSRSILTSPASTGHGHAGPAPAPPPHEEPSDSFVARYTRNVQQNFQRDGIPWTVAAAGMHGLVGGWLGGLAATVLATALPGPLAGGVVTAAQVAGLAGGFAWRLGRGSHEGHGGCH